MPNKKITAEDLPKGKRGKTPEAQLTEQVVDFMKMKGWRALRMSRGVATFGDRGTVTFGEPGMPDWLFLRYGREGLSMRSILWMEMKQSKSRESCRCATKKTRQRCTACDQRKWRMTETARGASVIRIESLEQLQGGTWWR
jgi:hypothetical protein